METAATGTTTAAMTVVVTTGESEKLQLFFSSAHPL